MTDKLLTEEEMTNALPYEDDVFKHDLFKQNEKEYKAVAQAQLAKAEPIIRADTAREIVNEVEAIEFSHPVIQDISPGIAFQAGLHEARQFIIKSLKARYGIEGE
jgi:hypothetical protein